MEKWKKLVAGLVALAAGAFYATHSHAAAPTQTQAPGCYRIMTGNSIPGVGQLRKDGSGHRFAPVSYTVPRLLPAAGHGSP